MRTVGDVSGHVAQLYGCWQCLITGMLADTIIQTDELLEQCNESTW